jgi:septal ring factor EnvC (AmiA/AmiB activator)
MTVASPANTGLDGASEPQAQPSRSKSRRGLWAAIIALSVVALAAGSGFAYSSNSARTWHDTSTRTATELGTTQRQRDELKTQLASTQSQLDGTKRDLGDLTGKYKEATDRIRALANEKAQVGDKAAYLDETVAISNLVTKELGGCVDNLQTLQGYLVNFQNYDSTQLINYATDINNACNQARSDNAILAKRLAGL